MPGKFHGQRSLVGYSPWGRKELDTSEQLTPSLLTWILLGFPGGSDGNEFACRTGDLGSIPGLEKRSPGEGNGYTLQYSCLGNPMDRGAWWATVPGVAKSRT